MANVEVYSTEACPFCVRARNLLNKKGVTFTEYRIDQDPALRPEMEKRADGRTSVPQVFIDDHHVGGFDELSELDVVGDLDEMLGLD